MCESFSYLDFVIMSVGLSVAFIGLAFLIKSSVEPKNKPPLKRPRKSQNPRERNYGICDSESCESVNCDIRSDD